MSLLILTLRRASPLPLLLLILGAGCSREARLARIAAEADELYAAGRIEEAELEYRNALGGRVPNPHVIGRLGIIYADQGRLLRAQSFLTRALELQPEEHRLRLRLGMTRMALGDLDAARNDALAVVEHLPRESDAVILLAETAVNLETLRRAQEILGRLRASAGEPAGVLVALALLELRERKLDGAEELLRQALAAEPKLPAAHSARGILRLARNDAEGAEESLRQATALAPSRPAHALALSRLLRQRGKAVEARQILDSWRKSHPTSLPILIALAELEQEAGRTEEALAALKQVFAREPAHHEAMVLALRLRLARGEFAEAVAEGERLTSNFPAWPVGHLQLAQAHLGRNDTSRAAASLATALQLAPDYSEAILLLARLQISRNEFSDAALALRKLTQQRPDLIAARVMLADTLTAMGNLEEALALLTQLDQALPDQPANLLKRGQLLLRLGRRAEAREIFRRSQELAPEASEALEGLVAINLAERQPGEARALIDGYIARNPNRAAGHLLLGRLLVEQGDQAGCEAALTKAVEVEPGSPVASFALARFLAGRKDVPRALAKVEATLKLTPEAPAPLMMKAVLLEQQGDSAGALAAYEKLTAIQPGNGIAQNNLSVLYGERFQQPDKAHERALKARELLPRDPSIADTLGWSFFRKGQYAAALPLLREAAQQLGDSAEVQYHLGAALYASGEEDAARSALQRALQLDPKLPSAADIKARLELLSFNPATSGPEARALLQRELAARGQDPLLLTRLAALQEVDGALDQALASYKAAVAVNPNHTRALAAIALLEEKRGQPDQALDAARAARKVAPTDPDVARLLGRLAVRSGQHVWGLSLLREAERRAPAAPELLFDLAEALVSVGDAAAESTLRRVLELAPGFPRAAEVRQILQLLEIARDPATPNAAAIVAAASQKAPRSAPALLAAAALARATGQAEASRTAFTSLLTAFPENVIARRELALLLMTNPDADARTLLEHATKAREAFPEDPAVAQALGIALYRQNLLPRALSLLEEAAAKRPADPLIPYHLGLIHRQQKNAAEARRALTRALELQLPAPAAATARQALAELENP
jgi:tetratricopeptide (TPR) repeat protein